jgi:hypothetical protein
MGEGRDKSPNGKRPLPCGAEVFLIKRIIRENIMIGNGFLMIAGNLGVRVIYLKFEGLGFGWRSLGFLIQTQMT